MLYIKTFQTQLGDMIALADHYKLHLFQFADYKKLQAQIDSIKKDVGNEIKKGTCAPLQLLEIELAAYFTGTLKQFTVPLKMHGTLFQKDIWNELLNIPYGKTLTYKIMAEKVNKPYAPRAVGTAHGANKITLIIPCHRVISTNGSFRGYANGPERKQWLLDFEQKNTECF